MTSGTRRARGRGSTVGGQAGASARRLSMGEVSSYAVLGPRAAAAGCWSGARVLWQTVMFMLGFLVMWSRGAVWR